MSRTWKSQSQRSLLTAQERNFLYIASVAPYNSSVFSKSLIGPLVEESGGPYFTGGKVTIRRELIERGGSSKLGMEVFQGPRPDPRLLLML
jgi:hypothetical protein